MPTFVHLTSTASELILEWG